MPELEFDMCFSKPHFLLPLVPFPSFSMLFNFWTILHTICSRIFSTITMKCGYNMSFARFDYYNIDVISHIFLSWWIFTSLHLLTALFLKDSDHTWWYLLMLLPFPLFQILLIFASQFNSCNFDSYLLTLMASFFVMIPVILTNFKIM